MKNLVLIFLLICLSCSSDDNSTVKSKRLLGSWKLVQVYGSSGADGSWSNVANGYVYTFIDDGRLNGNRFDCNGSYEVYAQNKIKVSFDCEQTQYTNALDFTLNGDFLIFMENSDGGIQCIEGCGEKYKRLD